MISFYTVPVTFFTEQAVAQLVEAVLYKPEGRGFVSHKYIFLPHTIYKFGKFNGFILCIFGTV
jgi:ABC-type polysaccharide/polyol phosphate export permease